MEEILAKANSQAKDSGRQLVLVDLSSLPPACADGKKGQARFDWPMGMAVDGNLCLFVADYNNCTLRKVTADGTVSTLAGTPERSQGVRGGFADGTGKAAQFCFPTALALDAEGALYVADRQNHVIRKVTPDGHVSTLQGKNPDQEGSADHPLAMPFSSPEAVAVDRRGCLYVCDGDRIYRIPPGGNAMLLAGCDNREETPGRDGKGAHARFYGASGMALDQAGNLYVADTLSHTIRKVSPQGVVTTLAGKTGQNGARDGRGPDARFFNPSALAVDGSGTLYVADAGNSAIRKIQADGKVTTLAGKLGEQGFADGQGPSARFYSPRGIAVDAHRTLYVADTINQVIRKISPAGEVTTLAGKGTP